MSADSRITVATEMHEQSKEKCTCTRIRDRKKGFPEIDDLNIQTGTFRDTQTNS